ncbi:Sushi domain-containing protein 4 [Sciurus carolinensis]|uniref:Sushi domain-containing protein 4 n=1 Tax=Sciurus carolinensis TaxID=30640 RepID=A0AA41T0U3_SCICA|nr:Sushi domain-containing protein 4 [Sciurus carolinensis]
MYHGMNPSNGDGFLEQQQQQQPQSPQRLLAVILWFQLALCFGPAQLTGGQAAIVTAGMGKKDNDGLGLEPCPIFVNGSTVGVEFLLTSVRVES